MTADNGSEVLVGKQGGYVQIPLDNLPQYAQALGRMLGHWAFLENRLMATLCLSLQLDYGRAKVVWQEFESTDRKINLLLRLNWSMGDNEMKNELAEILGRAQKLNKTRNEYVHALWVIDHEGQVVRQSNMAPGSFKKISRESQVVTAEEIESDVLKIATLVSDLTEWQRRINGAPPGTRVQPVEPA